MLRYQVTLITLLLLSGLTCGAPSPEDATQDSVVEESTLRRVSQREELFHSAYGALDAAVLERVLHDDFIITYTHPPAEKDKSRFVRELGELRVVFPDLTLTVDASTIVQQDNGALVSGTRTFRWRYDDEVGSYAEGFRHHWISTDGGYQLLRAEVLPPLEE